MWKCKECGCEITGLGGITYETWGSLDKNGDIKKHHILEEVDSATDLYSCENCGIESETLNKIGIWEEQ